MISLSSSNLCVNTETESDFRNKVRLEQQSMLEIDNCDSEWSSQQESAKLLYKE